MQRPTDLPGLLAGLSPTHGGVGWALMVIGIRLGIAPVLEVNGIGIEAHELLDDPAVPRRADA